MDGASYHIHEDTIKYLERNQVNVFIAAPYSYDGAAAEMWFSYLKSKDLNPNLLSTGKM
jgi:transposase